MCPLPKIPIPEIPRVPHPSRAFCKRVGILTTSALFSAHVAEPESAQTKAPPQRSWFELNLSTSPSNPPLACHPERSEGPMQQHRPGLVNHPNINATEGDKNTMSATINCHFTPSTPAAPSPQSPPSPQSSTLESRSPPSFPKQTQFCSWSDPTPPQPQRSARV